MSFSAPGGILLLASLLGLAAACKADPPRCRFGAEFSLFHSEAQMLHGLRALAATDGVLALFSDAKGLHAQLLAPDGRPRAAARVIVPACDAGFDAVQHAGEIALACARRAPPGGVAGAGQLTLYAIDAALVPREQRQFGTLGRASQGVALASAGGRLLALWHDAALSGSRIWSAEPLGAAPPRQLSDEAWDASAPGLASAADGRVYATWGETRLDQREPRGRVLLAELGGRAPARVVLTTHEPEPSPRLLGSSAGLTLSFRDKREKRRRTGLYLVRLAADGRIEGEVVRVGRADGEGAPALEDCQGGLVSAVPRTFAGDYFVGVMWADAPLSRLTQEQQFYEDSREFDRVALHCGAAGALLVIGERGRLHRGGAGLRSTTFQCR